MDRPAQAAAAEPLTREQIVTLGAAIACVTVVGVGLSLSSPLISLVLSARGVSGTVIGLNAAFASLATLLVGSFVPRIAAAIGLRTVLFASLCIGGLTMAAFPLFPSLPAWFALRFVFGAAVGTLFVLAEFWINAAAPPTRRGIVMGVYATALSLGFAIGPAILTIAGGASDKLFWIGAAFFALASLPISLAGGNAPPLEGRATHGIFGLIALAPIATIAGFLYGAIEQGSFAFLAIYGERVGLSITLAAFLVTLFGLGNVVSQIPLGLLSDRIDRRVLMLACALVGFAGTLAMPVASLSPAALMPLVFVVGGAVGGLYTIGLAQLGSRFTGSALATANAAFVMLYSMGMLTGTPAIGAVFDAVHPHGYAYAIAFLCGAYCLLVLWRIRRNQN